MLTNSTLCQWDFKFFPNLCQSILPYDLVFKAFVFTIRLLITKAACYFIFQVCFNNKAEEVISPDIPVCTYPPLEHQEAISPGFPVVTLPTLKQQVRFSAKYNLTKSMAIINKWISKNQCRKLHTVIPEHPTEPEQKRFSRLVMLELLLSSRTSRLQKLLRQALLKTDNDAIKRVDAVSTLFLLALGVEVTMPGSEGSLQNLVSAGFLSTTSNRASKQFFLWMAPFDVTEKELMLELGFDAKRYKLLSVEKKPPTDVECDNFLKKHKFMTHPGLEIFSEISERILIDFAKMSNQECLVKILEIEKGICNTETRVHQLTLDLISKTQDFLAAPRHKFFPATGSGEHDVLTQIMLNRRLHLELLVRAEKMVSRKEEHKLYNAIFVANLNIFPFGRLVERLVKTRVSYENMLRWFFNFRRQLDDFEENSADWILMKLVRRIPLNMTEVCEWDYVPFE
ncbi:hypothetical protein MFLAVUS_010036 [Mucor flavus]|uniref:Uncharacterized protein n=1 Tax=Mucor flavus TaxID=439312 RepID=A0ABP9ZBM5_9FUNG